MLQNNINKYQQNNYFRKSKINFFKEKSSLASNNNNALNRGYDAERLEDCQKINRNSLHNAFRPLIIMAQCISLLPVSGIYSSNVNDLRFEWKSCKTLYTLVILISSILMTLCSWKTLMTTTFNSHKLSITVFHTTVTLSILLFLKLARDWPEIAMSWENLDHKLSANFNSQNTNRSGLSRKFKIIIVIIMMPAITEHVLSTLYGYHKSLYCAKLSKEKDYLAVFYKAHFPHVFSWIKFTWWKAIIAQYTVTLNTLCWNFMDLFLVLIGLALTDQFKQLNSKMQTMNKNVTTNFWSESRKMYNDLAKMTLKIDSKISAIILLSFCTNVYFISIQLINVFNRMPNVIEQIYFFFSFGLLLLRTTAVTISVAKINEESLVPAQILYDVEDTNYNTEVQRFLYRVTTDRISLTGLKLFSINRNLLLKIGSTIVTYVLILMEYKVTKSDYHESNSHVINPCDT